MSLLFFQRVLANPFRVGYVVPSSPFLTRQTAKRLDFSKPRVVVELGPGEGCHTRQILRRMCPGSTLLLLELDEAFANHLKTQFAGDRRVIVVHADARHLATELKAAGITRCDYIVSGLPFFLIKEPLKRELLAAIADAMDDETVFVTYQVSLQLAGESQLFRLADKKYCPLNIPPINILEFRKAA
ncbi:MAG: rRNA adenine N-6-methyltransferase family protein [Terrimicrobiaceae bacterium]